MRPVGFNAYGLELNLKRNVGMGGTRKVPGMPEWRRSGVPRMSLPLVYPVLEAFRGYLHLIENIEAHERYILLQ